MIVVDANLLLYSYDRHSPDHTKSSAWLEKVLSGSESVGLPLQSLMAFLRVVTNRRLPGMRVSLEQGLEAVEEWMQQPHVRILIPGDGYWAVFRSVVVEGQAPGPLVSDAELAALTIEYGGVLHTADRDFARFPGLRWVNPLAS